MDSQTASASGSGFPPPGSDMGQLPPIHAPDTFRAPDSQMPHFATAVPGGQIPAAPAASQPLALAGQPMQSSLTGAGAVPVPAPVAAGVQAQVLAGAAPDAPAEEPDTAFDEEWVGMARDLIGRTHTDPFLESKELSKLKAQYIKARYNKDIKISEG